MVKKENIIENILISIFVILAIIGIIQLVLKLTGHSPSELQLLYIGFGCIGGYLFILTAQLSKFSGKTEYFMNHTTKELKEMKSDIKENKDNINKIFFELEKINLKL